jgi:hypothetical protein
MKDRGVGISVLLIMLAAGCTNWGADGQSARVSNPAAQRAGNPEARFQQYGPLAFLGKYRIRHEWVHEDPYGSHYCHGYSSVREDVVDELGEKRPALMGMDMWENGENLVQRRPYFKPDGTLDMTRFVIGKYRPNAPGGPRYSDHEALCSTAFDGIGNVFKLYLKKSALISLREWDAQRVSEWRYAKLLEPLRYEVKTFAGMQAEKVTEIASVGLKGVEDKPVRRVTEEIRVPIGDTGYVYQLAFTLSDTIVQNEPEKTAWRRAYWLRIQDSFRIDALQR